MQVQGISASALLWHSLDYVALDNASNLKVRPDHSRLSDMSSGVSTDPGTNSEPMPIHCGLDQGEPFPQTVPDPTAISDVAVPC